MTFIPGPLPTGSFPVAPPIIIAPPPGRLTRLFASLLEDAATAAEPIADPAIEPDSTNKAGQEQAPTRSTVSVSFDALLNLITSIKVAGVAEAGAQGEQSPTPKDVHDAPNALAEKLEATVGDARSAASAPERIRELVRGFSALSPVDLQPRLTDDSILPLSGPPARSIPRVHLLNAEGQLFEPGIAAILENSIALVSPDRDRIDKASGQNDKATRTVRLRIDQDAFKDISINPRPVRIEIPVDLDIPSTPQPIRSDADKQLMALTEIGMRSQANHTAAAVMRRVVDHDAVYDPSVRSGKVITLELANLRLKAAAPFATEAGAPLQNSWLKIPAPVDTRVLFDRPVQNNMDAFERAPSRAIPDVSHDIPVRSAWPINSLVQAMAAAPRTIAAREGAPSLQNVRFTLENWMPGQTVSHLRVALDPVELGGVRVHLSDRGGELFARIVVEQPAALPVITSNFEALRSAMAQRGIQFSGFSVTLAGAASAVGLPADARQRIELSARKADSRSTAKLTRRVA